MALSFVFGADQIEWRKNYDEGLAEAKKLSRPVFVDVYAEWCTWCHKLDKEVYSNPKMIAFLKGYIAVKVDSEDNKDGTQFAEKYDVTGLPTMMVTDPSGNVTNRFTGYKTAEELIGEIEEVQRLVDAEKKSPGEETNYRIANLYMDREMYKEAESRFKQILASPSSSQAHKEKAQFSMGVAEYYQGNLEKARGMLETYHNTYKDGESGEDALLLLSQVHIELSSNIKAVEYLREFMKKYPKSENLVRAHEVLDALVKECKC